MNSKVINEYTLEIMISFIGAIIGLILELNNRSDAAIIIGVLPMIIAASTIVVKLHISKISDKLLVQFKTEISKYIEPIKYLSNLDGIALKHAKNVMDKAAGNLKEIKEGKIFLEQETYYEHLNSCMRLVPINSTVIAINTIDSMRWSNDSNQVRYYEENLKAIERGVKIHRIFLLRKESLTDIDRINSIKQQMKQENIKIDIVFIEELVGFQSDLEDIVIFNCQEEQRLYVDYPDNTNRTHIAYAYLHLSPIQIQYRYNVYKKLQNYCLSDKLVKEIIYAEK